MMKHLAVGLITLLFLSLSYSVAAKQIITLSPTEKDMTPVVRTVLEGINEKDVKIVFEEGTYFFRPDYAQEKYCYITNHGNGLKKMTFLFENLDNVELEGNGAKLIFHGQMFPFRFDRCGKITVKDLTIDWDIPFNFLGEVVAVNPDEGWRDIKPETEGFSWTVKKNRLYFPNIDGFNFDFLGSTLTYEPNSRKVIHGAWDMNSTPRWVEKRPKGILRIHEPLKHYPPVGSRMNSKGEKGPNRYAPAMQIINSKNVHLEGVVIHHALGMGFLFERTEDIIIKDCGIYVEKDSKRVVSIIADATHFCNCKGDILIEGCRFENMLDDGTNVHGTYVEVDEVMDEKSVRVKLRHFEQQGFEFAGVGDDIWFVHQPSPDRTTDNKVTNIKVLNGKYSVLTFQNKLPKELSKGDILENKTWNPTFTMRGCTIKDHRARNVVIKTPKKIVIEDNDFSSMMSSILFRGETFFWFESGQVADVLIQNNRFNHCAYSGAEHAIMYVTPRLGKSFDQTALFDRNIRFINNEINTFGNRIVIADRVDGLVISGNKIKQTTDAPSLYPNAPLFDFKNCQDVNISKNKYEGTNKKGIKTDATTAKTLKVKRNKGFSKKYTVGK